MNIYKIVLTGGPCAGKTTVLNKVKELLEKDDYYVVTIPETATTLIKNSMPPLENHNHALKFQELVLNIQLFKEEITKMYCQNTIVTNPDFFKNKKGIIILCDRGIMDNRAYLSQEEFDNMLKNNNLNIEDILNYYDLVINLISLASTNKELYKLDGIRYETAEMASIRDQITTNAWKNHHNLKIIRPTEMIEEKIEIVYNIIIENIKKDNITKKKTRSI